MKSSVYMIWIYLFVLLFFVSAAFWGNKAITAFSQNSPIERSRCFVIDAGHGGVDGGTTSCTGVLESRINLEVAVCLNDLMHLLGYETKMIRTEDISVYTEGESIAQKKISDLKQRVKICNETENAFVLSIHQNYFTDSRYSGAQVFYPATAGSEAFSKELQKELIRHLNPGSNRKAKKAQGVYLMEHLRCPGALIECGFLSNPEEEAKLRSSEYQKKLCCVIAVTAVSFALDAQTND